MGNLFPRSASCIRYVCGSIYVSSWEKCLITSACFQWHRFSQGWIKIFFSCPLMNILCVQGEGIQGNLCTVGCWVSWVQAAPIGRTRSSSPSHVSLAEFTNRTPAAIIVLRSAPPSRRYPVKSVIK